MPYVPLRHQASQWQRMERETDPRAEIKGLAAMRHCGMIAFAAQPVNPILAVLCVALTMFVCAIVAYYLTEGRKR